MTLSDIGRTGAVTEQDFDYEVYRLMQELQRGHPLVRLRADMTSDAATLALRQNANGLIRDLATNPNMVDMVDTRQKVRKYTALLAVERMLSYGGGIELDFPGDEIARIYSPAKQHPKEGFDLRMLDLKFL